VTRPRSPRGRTSPFMVAQRGGIAGVRKASPSIRVIIPSDFRGPFELLRERSRYLRIEPPRLPCPRGPPRRHVLEGERLRVFGSLVSRFSSALLGVPGLVSRVALASGGRGDPFVAPSTNRLSLAPARARAPTDSYKRLRYPPQRVKGVVIRASLLRALRALRALALRDVPPRRSVKRSEERRARGNSREATLRGNAA
jgi:hypothetical protein